MTLKVGRVTPCAPSQAEGELGDVRGAQGTARPTRRQVQGFKARNFLSANSLPKESGVRAGQNIN
jgi:hypothetical protein